MAGVINVKVIDELKPFLNKDNVIEIAIRDKKKRFVELQKVTLANLQQNDQKDKLEKAIKVMHKNNAALKKNLKMINKIAHIQQLGLVLNAANLCATCVGFAIMNAKLEKLSGQLDQLMSTVKQGNSVRADFEFKKVLSEHADMLDSRKRQKYYTEEQMRKLVDDEYNVLSMLIDVYNKDIADDKNNLIVSIYTMASMMAVSLKYFDELYYYNNKEAIGDGDKWHSSHDNWMSVFDRLTNDDFITGLQDHAIFDLDLSTEDADVYYLSLRDQIMEMVESIKDNQSLIETFDNDELYEGYNDYIRQEVTSDIQKALEETDGALDDQEVVGAYQNAMKQVGLV